MEPPRDSTKYLASKKLSAAKSKQHRLTNGHPVTYFSSLASSFPLFFPHHSSLASFPLPLFPLLRRKHVQEHVLCGTLSATPRTLPWRNDLDDNFILCYRVAHVATPFRLRSPNVFHELIYIGTLAFALYVLINGFGESIFDQTPPFLGPKYVPGEAKRDLLGFPKVESYSGNHESFFKNV